MSWLFSQALVAEFLADACLDGEPSAPSSGNPIQLAFLPPDRMTAFSRLSRFGMTFKPLTEDRGAELLTSYLEDFPVRTFQPQEKAKESTESAAECGSTWQELSVKYCLVSSSWKTHRSLWEEVLPWSSVTLPRWGMTRSGLLFQHPTLERPISANASGLWQTPVADDSLNRAAGKWNSRGEPKLSAQMMFPTPLVGETGAACHGQISGRFREKLAEAFAKWPTPKANDAKKVGNFDISNRRNGLPAAAKSWPTPTKSDHKGSGPQMLRSDGKMRGDRLDYATERTPVGESTGGQLNPTWVEWLMGWPLGWTDLRPLATDKYREWQKQHSVCLLRMPDQSAAVNAKTSPKCPT